MLRQENIEMVEEQAMVLLVDDDPGLTDILARLIRKEGHFVEYRESLTEGLKEANKKDYDVVFLDVRMPDGDGMEYVTNFRNAASNPEIILITSKAKTESIDMALKKGALMYMSKPHSHKDLLDPLRDILNMRRERRDCEVKNLTLKGIIGTCRLMMDCMQKAAKAARCDASTLITGETGTGKELMAKAIHQLSDRAKEKLVTVDCAAITETLALATLLGSKKGAFTDGKEDHEGYLLEADKGTLFLDEVGDLPYTIQMHLLRVLEGHPFRPIGGNKDVKSNFRVVAATSKNLEELVESGAFRRDLFQRLKAVSIQLPPLRDRGDDIRKLIDHYLKFHLKRLKIEKKLKIPVQVLEILENYPWPGNVRELVNAIGETLINVGDAPSVYFKDLPMAIRAHGLRQFIIETSEEQDPLENLFDENLLENLCDDNLPAWKAYRDEAIKRIEREYLLMLRKHCKKDTEKAMDRSGLSKARIFALYKKHDIS